MARAQSMLERCGAEQKKFFRFVFVYCHSQKRNGNEMMIPEVAYFCFAMLSVSLCGTFNRLAVHENESEKSFTVISATSQHILSTGHVRQQFPKILSILLGSLYFNNIKKNILTTKS